MSIIDILGTDVDTKPAPQPQAPKVSSYTTIIEQSVCVTIIMWILNAGC